MPDPAEPGYELHSHAPVVDDPDWSICTFQDPANAGAGGLTVTVSAGALDRLMTGDLSRPLSATEVMALDGH
jgi:hypothetical protein